MFYKSIILAFCVVTSIAAPVAREASLEPWQITLLGTRSSSGRPGNDPNSSLQVSISDPNWITGFADTGTGPAAFPPTSADCTVSWPPGEEPWGVAQPCTSKEEGSYATWTVTLLQGTNGVTDFGLKFDLSETMNVIGVDYTKKYTATESFKTGDNLQYVCGGSGACSAGLTDIPFSLQQTAVDQ